MSRASVTVYTLYVKGTYTNFILFKFLVVACRKLKSADSNGMRFPNHATHISLGLSDPYCKLTCGKQKDKTKIKKKVLLSRFSLLIFVRLLIHVGTRVSNCTMNCNLNNFFLVTMSKQAMLLSLLSMIGIV